jgi:tetratricopeptide (TPR) repeat protein
MAAGTKKDKLIEEAQKLLLRGQFDKAVKIHEQLLAMEPSAINQRQKVAELLLKAGRPDDARREFETIGTHYSKNGFYLKAIAVYKQLQKLFPADILLTLTLAELNEKHGLVANALYEYQRVHDFHVQAGVITDAVRILDRMQNVDPQNIPVKIKLAETYLKHAKKDEAYKLFSRSASLLQERGEQTLLARLNTRIQQLFPDKTDFVLEVLADQVNAGNATGAIEGLQRILRSDPTNKRVWDLIIAAYKQLDLPPRLKIAYQHYLKYFPTEPGAMAGLITCLITERDLVTALELLDRYEPDLISAGFQQERHALYRGLADLDPLNHRIQEGLLSCATAHGSDSEAAALSSSQHAQDSGSPFDQSKPDVAIETLTDHQEKGEEQEQEADELEIEIDIDYDSTFEPLTNAQEHVLGQADGMESTKALLEPLVTTPRGVRFGDEMDRSDTQSHFDLGLAFKDMGLFDEAIQEFSHASINPQHRLGALIMQAVCLRERGELEQAVSTLQTLLKPDLSPDDICAVQYELAVTYETIGCNQDASALLNEIYVRCPGFRDVSSRLNAVNLEGPLDFSEEELQGFGPK